MHDSADLAPMALDFGDPRLAEEWLFKSAKSLSAFWLPDERCFLRATGPALVRGGEAGATSSNRAFLATTEVLFHLAEEARFELRRKHTDQDAGRWQRLCEDLTAYWQSMSAGYYGKSVDWLRDHSDNGRNDFTDAHLLISLSILGSRFAQRELGYEPPVERRQDLERFVAEYEAKIETEGGARIAESGPTHPLLTLYAARAIEVARHVTGTHEGRSRVSDTLESMIRDAATDDAFRQLGMHAAKEARFDPAALMGDVALLHRYAGMSARRLVEKGVELLRDTQQPDGSWKTQILTGDRKLVYLPSLDLAVALANLVLSDLTEGSTDLARIALPTLERSLEFVESGYWESSPRDGRPISGWSNDQARQSGVVESWSTALALQLQLRVRRVARRYKQHLTLAKYRTVARDPERREWLRWPDLAGPIALVRSADAEAQRAKKGASGFSVGSPGQAALG